VRREDGLYIIVHAREFSKKLADFFLKPPLLLKPHNSFVKFLQALSRCGAKLRDCEYIMHITYYMLHLLLRQRAI
jgi:hypothetical protein